MARLYREAPLNSIWEGSGNVMCLDVLRALKRNPESLNAFLTVCSRARGHHAAFDARLNALRATLNEATRWPPERVAAQARRISAELALCLQGSILVEHAPEAISTAFCEARLQDATPRVYGDLSTRVDVDAVLKRAEPLLDSLRLS